MKASAASELGTPRARIAAARPRSAVLRRRQARFYQRGEYPTS